MRQTVREQNLKLLGAVAGERVTHLNGFVQPEPSILENSIQIFPGMVAAGKEQGNLVWPHFGDNAGGKDSRALRSGLSFLLFEALHSHRRVIIVHELPGGSHGEKFLTDRVELPGCLLHQFPLRGLGQWHPKILLHFLHPIMRQPAPKTQQPEHHSHIGGVFGRAGLGRRRGGVDSAAEIAPQLLQFKNRGRKDRLGRNANNARGLPQAQLALVILAIRTSRPNAQARMSHRHPLGAHIPIGSIATVTFAPLFFHGRIG